MTHPHFNEAAWIARLAVALEAVAANARPSYSPLPPEITRSTSPLPPEIMESLRSTPLLNSTAWRQFNELTLWVKTDLAEAESHPARASADKARTG